MSLARKLEIVEFHVLATKIPIIWFRVTNIHCPFDAGPRLVHVFSGTGKFEVVHIDYQHAIQFRMVENTLRNIRQDLFPTLFTDSGVQMIFPNPSTVRMSVQC